MSGWERIVGTTSLDDETAKTAEASCSAGRKVVGGGYVLSGRSGTALTRSLVDGSYPLDDDTWQVTTRSTAGGGDNSYAVTVYAICTTALP
ncbi:MAG: hypothetical protein AB7H93_21080 [Vicinamibacterales bacterium]